MAKAFASSASNVLGTMAGIKPAPGVPYIKSDVCALGDVTAIVGITGALKGSVAVTFTKKTALAVVKAMLGDDIQDLMQDIKDTVGEIANMISGQARAKFSDEGIVLQGSTPTIIFGDSHKICHTGDAKVIAIEFTTEAGPFAIEFCLG